MNFYVTAIGSGKTLNYPHQKKYEGILALAENTKENGFFYLKGFEKMNLSQEEIFKMKYQGTEYNYKNMIKINTWESTYDIGKQILTEIDNIKKQFSSVRFHFEIAAGYKRIGSILTLISYIRSNDIYKLTFLSHENQTEVLPIVKIELHSKEKEILTGFRKGSFLGWNEKINTNKYVLTYSKDKKYIYKVLKKCKEIGLLDENNRITDFGNLYLDFC